MAAYDDFLTSFLNTMASGYNEGGDMGGQPISAMTDAGYNTHRESYGAIIANILSEAMRATGNRYKAGSGLGALVGPAASAATQPQSSPREVFDGVPYGTPTPLPVDMMFRAGTTNANRALIAAQIAMSQNGGGGGGASRGAGGGMSRIPSYAPNSTPLPRNRGVGGGVR